MRIHGSCHCGNISFEFDLPGEAKELAVRACGCTFCVKHGGVWTSHKDGKLIARLRDPAGISRYRMGTETAEFYVCARCGAVPFVTSEIESRLYAVVNVNSFEGIDPGSLARMPVSFDGESTESRLERRKQRWIPEVSIA